MTTTEDDAIEILSCHIEHEELVVEPATKVSISVTKSKLEDDPATRHRKRVARAVAVVSFMLLLFSVVLIGVSLNMSKNIDELGHGSPFSVILVLEKRLAVIITFKRMDTQFATRVLEVLFREIAVGTEATVLVGARTIAVRAVAEAIRTVAVRAITRTIEEAAVAVKAVAIAVETVAVATVAVKAITRTLEETAVAVRAVAIAVETVAVATVAVRAITRTIEETAVAVRAVAIAVETVAVATVAVRAITRTIEETAVAVRAVVLVVAVTKVAAVKVATAAPIIVLDCL
ncbi:hypothetical protein LOTGIDRAFT_176186 [Lottia gigantea]|uniref:Uncharacterized protein n=1 Tax=Lottia gigantea TaxID=225164 RepID=V3ZJ47_LOTGI|nr:hypothetical protein LOTGIDRAFT_176186 [Lottia gigantea]ESO84292.1 hypothetical protein LOTGIDRAFT_176186 [Lottia gigantea]